VAARTFAFLILVLFTFPAAAQKVEIPEDELQEILRVKIRAVKRLAANRVVINAVKEQNMTASSLDQIKKIDDKWRSTEELTRFKKSLQTNSAGQYLRKRVRRNATYGEAFLTDSQGANVAAYPATSDYWQGDEKKFTASFNGGEGKVFIGPVEFDDSSKNHVAQVSVPVLDRGKTIGVLVVGVKLNYIAWKQSQVRRKY